MVTLLAFYKMLEEHNWYFGLHPDQEVWDLGVAECKQFMQIRKQSPEHEELFKAYSKYMSSGPSWGSEQAKKPERPKE